MRIILAALLPLSLMAVGLAAPEGKTYVYKEVDGQTREMEIYFPNGEPPAKPVPGIIMFHGGGWGGGDRGQFRYLCHYFASRGLVASTVTYRLAGKAKKGGKGSRKRICMPDAKSAIRWYKQHAAELGIDPTRIIAGGGSAGGHISLIATTNPGLNDPNDPPGFDTSVAAYLLFNPALSIADAKDPEIDVLAHLDADFPPAIAFFGNKDSWLKGWKPAYAKLKSLGSPIDYRIAEGQSHAFFNKQPWADVTIAAADRFLVKHGYLQGEPTLPKHDDAKLVPAESKHPNIVYILADDMGYDSVSALNPKMGALKTPAIDRLLREGRHFTDAHSGSSVCTPTRYGILTGRYCWRTRLKNSVLWSWGQPLIKQERLTVGEMLQQQGYRSGMVGKWHLGMAWPAADGQVANRDVQQSDAIFRKGPGAERLKVAAARIDFSKPITDGPIQHGFDYYFGVDVPNFPPYAWIENDRVQGTPSEPKPAAMFGQAGPMVPGWQLENLLPQLAEKSAAWISEQAKADQPFFLYLPLTSPHAPISPSARFQGKSGINSYADFLLETDWVVGEVLRALDESGVADDTLVIFTADNGTSRGFAKYAELEKSGVNIRASFRADKASIYEGGHRVPFILRWPGKAAAGSSCAETICLNDFMATAAAITGAELPANAAEDSNNILPLFLGNSAAPGHSLVVNHSIGGQFAIRRGKWKLVLAKRTELYDLEADVKETKNLAQSHPELVTELRSTLQRYQREGRSVSR
jgi:arylsulfatase A-like enzyme/acetyl esterase/lipase